MGGTVLIQQLLIWGIDFVEEFLYNNEFTNEKVSVAMIVFGSIHDSVRTEKT